MVRITPIIRPPSFGRSYPAEVLLDAPSRYYRLGETSGTDAFDIGSDGVNGTYTNTPTLGQPALVRGGDGAAQFAGASSEMMTGTVLSSPTLPVTIECWVKFDSLTGNQTIVSSNRDTGNYRGINLGAIGDDFQLVLGDGSGASGSDRRSWVVANIFSIGPIYHIVVVVNSHTSAEVWINGVQQSPSTSGSAGGVALTGGTLSVAANSKAGSTYLSGTVDEVAFYNNKALNSDRILAHYNAGI